MAALRIFSWLGGTLPHVVVHIQFSQFSQFSFSASPWQAHIGSHSVSQSVSFSASPWPAHILLTSSQIRGRLTPGQLPLFIHRNAVWRHWWRHYGGISGGMAAWLAAHNASSGIVAALVAALAPPAALAAAWRHGGISGGMRRH